MRSPSAAQRSAHSAALACGGQERLMPHKLNKCMYVRGGRNKCMYVRAGKGGRKR